jgi:hypothetical protein
MILRIMSTQKKNGDYIHDYRDYLNPSWICKDFYHKYKDYWTTQIEYARGLVMTIGTTWT